MPLSITDQSLTPYLIEKLNQTPNYVTKTTFQCLTEIMDQVLQTNHGQRSCQFNPTIMAPFAKHLRQALHNQLVPIQLVSTHSKRLHKYIDNVVDHFIDGYASYDYGWSLVQASKDSYQYLTKHSYKALADDTLDAHQIYQLSQKLANQLLDELSIPA